MTSDRIRALRNVYIHYPALIVLAALHLAALAAIPYLYFYGIHGWELAYHLIAYPLGGFGITALYHRAWTHGGVKFARPVEYILAAGSTFILQMPAKQWISSHIKHHDHTDHDDDPYNIQRGFWWAHFEWIIFAPVPEVELPTRLHGNPVIEWQDKYYWPISVMLNLIIPAGISVAVGAPWWGGVLISALRVAFMCNVVFAVNSVCHVWGTRPFTRDVSAKNVWWFPFALGEQYHNFHHAFPRDYRHGVGRFDFDPTKWLIMGLAKFGLATQLFAMPERRIAEARRQAELHGDTTLPDSLLVDTPATATAPEKVPERVMVAAE
jgi:stearoyl-CoA desaturase (Delta-9 desaturase)